ncbi:hypothetical protein CVT24_012559 [Panaeolus cyanescens]|uniref:NADH dehydrogenase [ubiquinone] 1 alpha subcomplex subunit n=1 Tax=Panaeolus cyanescens TaxID=181874 RepID=A0A409W2K7_9AGAR|nr:hypothetical protein CVT24_012559 [Panaeolus cyanescens]
MSFFSRILSHIRTPIRYVGRDLEGNTFYEMKNWNDPSRTKRTVQYHIPEDSWKYIGGGKRLPVQWTAWLTHTRPNPPTIEELQADQLRMERLQANVARIEARDRAEAEERRRLRQEDAKQAIEDAAQRVVQQSFIDQPRVDPTEEVAQPSFDAAASSVAQPQTEPSASTNPVTRALKAAAPSGFGVKVRPPSFLTPATPRKQARAGSGTGSFTPPILEEDNTESPKAKEESPAPWTSKPLAETESWVPQAKKRG